MAWYHLGLISDALSAFEMWVSRALKWHRARGLLLIAALALKNGDRAKAKETLLRATEFDTEYVADQLKSSSFPRIPERPAAVVPRQQPTLAASVRNRLLLLVQPRRPELSLLLTIDEMEVFTSASALGRTDPVVLT